LGSKQSDCIVGAKTTLQCVIGTNILPNTYDIELLYQCQEIVSTQSLQIVYVQSNPSARTPDFTGINSVLTSESGSFNFKMPNLKVSLWTDRPIISNVKPLSGPITGGTNVVISGTYLSNITACRFSILKQLYIVSSVYINNEVICISPNVSINGTYGLDLNYKNENWITTKYKFNYYLLPVYFHNVKLSVQEGMMKDFDIYGELFPKGRVYCKIAFLKSSVILSGKWLSSSHIVCLKVI
jgi:hypothetical protein